VRHVNRQQGRAKRLTRGLIVTALDRIDQNVAVRCLQEISLLVVNAFPAEGLADLVRALPDFANSVLKGDLDFNYRAMKEMFARAYNISHVKDGEADDNGKVLNIDIKKTFEIAKAANYRGFFSMEYDAPGDPYAPTKKLIELTLQNIS